MQISSREDRGVTVLRPAGRLDTLHGPALDDAIARHFDSDSGPLVLDMSEIDYVSSFGLSVLLKGARIAQGKAIGFRVAALHPAVERMFELSGFGNFLGVHADCESAIAAIAAG